MTFSKLPILGNELLNGDIVYLAAPTLADLEILEPYFNSMSHMRISGVEIAFPRFSSEQVLDNFNSTRQKKQGYAFVIRRKDDHSTLGLCILRDINWQMRSAVLGISLGDLDLRGKGYGSAALRLLVSYGFMELNLNRIELRVSSYNEIAIASYRKVGFVLEATLREAVYRDLRYYDVHVMSLLSEEWKGLST